MARARVQVAVATEPGVDRPADTWVRRHLRISQRPDHRPYHLSSRIHRTLVSRCTPLSVSLTSITKQHILERLRSRLSRLSLFSVSLNLPICFLICLSVFFPNPLNFLVTSIHFFQLFFNCVSRDSDFFNSFDFSKCLDSRKCSQLLNPFRTNLAR